MRAIGNRVGDFENEHATGDEESKRRFRLTRDARVGFGLFLGAEARDPHAMERSIATAANCR